MCCGITTKTSKGLTIVAARNRQNKVFSSTAWGDIVFSVDVATDVAPALHISPTPHTPQLFIIGSRIGATPLTLSVLLFFL